MKIDIDTKFITLLGTPLGQSFAARMQNAGYEAARLNMLYFYTELDNTHLGDVVNGLRYMNFAGFAVTKPNKVEILKYLDELDPLCRKMGSCNTVVITQDKKLKGYNTDGLGFIRSIKEDTNLEISSTAAFCMGAGGAGRAICSILAYNNIKKLYVTDIFEESANALASDLKENFSPVDVEVVKFGDFEKVKDCNLLINATGVGMGKSVGSSPIAKNLIPANIVCFDACYNPAKTQFLIDSEQKGCQVLNGLNMSLFQGVAQIELWTGKEAPYEAMKNELIKIISE